MGVDGYQLESISNIRGFNLWEPIYLWGSNAVQLFWLISGFVFIHVYGGKTTVTWKNFMINRFARLYPLHFITLSFILILQLIAHFKFNSYFIYHINDFYHYFLNLFFASEWGAQKGRSFNGPIWSVSVEIFSYIIFCMMLIHFKISKLSSVCILLFSSLAYLLTKNQIFLCLLYFFSGVLTYSLMKFLISKGLNKTIIICISGITISILSLNSDITIPLIIYYIPLFGFTVILFSCLDFKFAYYFPKSLSFIGNTSYSNYLLHSPLQVLFLLFTSFGVVNFSIVFNGFFIIGYITVTILVSIFSFHYIEKPLQTWVKNLFTSQKIRF